MKKRVTFEDAIRMGRACAWNTGAGAEIVDAYKLGRLGHEECLYIIAGLLHELNRDADADQGKEVAP